MTSTVANLRPQRRPVKVRQLPHAVPAQIWPIARQERAGMNYSWEPRIGRANSATAGPIESITLRNIRHGSGVWPPTATR